MIEMVFELAGEVVVVKLDGVKINFSNALTGYRVAVPIDMIKLDSKGIVKEFPDLKGRPEGIMRKEAIGRFKDNVRSMKTEGMRKKYIIKEFEGMGYSLKMVHRRGFRPTKF